MTFEEGPCYLRSYKEELATFQGRENSGQRVLSHKGSVQGGSPPPVAAQQGVRAEWSRGIGKIGLSRRVELANMGTSVRDLDRPLRGTHKGISNKNLD